ncbi:metallophosphoesterase family protein [Paenibacillus sp. A14]|uniref:metallophosphoesterase family protein n=1 Tax=Paenibacillus sp. A14 TaxID=3119820 RepID=UPI002FE26F69
MKTRSGGRAQLKVVCLAEEPIEQLPYTAAAPGSQGVSNEYLPVYLGEMLGLPDEVDALIVASDLQGMAGHGPLEGRSSRLIGEELPELLALLLENCLPRFSPERVVALLCGDLYGDPGQRGSSGDPLPVWEAFHRQFGTVLGVAGNHDLFTAEGSAKLEAAPGVDFYAEPKTAPHRGLVVGGLGGVTGRAGKPNRRPEADYLNALRNLLRRGPDVLLLHQGPDVPALGLPGHPGIRRELEAAPSLLVCCGHVHWERPLAELGNGTQVINADGRVLVFTAAE